MNDEDNAEAATTISNALDEDAKAETVACKVCEAEYATEECMQEHLWADHVDVLWQNKLWRCESCTYQTHRGDDVERHMRNRRHRMLRWLACHKCNWMFGTGMELREHLDQNHLNHPC